MDLSPHWGLEDPSVVQLSLYFFLFVSISVRLFFSLSSCMRRFLAIICVAHNCAQRMRPQHIKSNTLNGSIICLSACLSVRLYVVLLRFWYLYYFTVWGFSAVMNLSPHWGPKDPIWVQSSLYVHTSVCLSICMSLCLSVRSSALLFGNHFHAL